MAKTAQEIVDLLYAESLDQQLSRSVFVVGYDEDPWMFILISSDKRYAARLFMDENPIEGGRFMDFGFRDPRNAFKGIDVTGVSLYYDENKIQTFNTGNMYTGQDYWSAVDLSPLFYIDGDEVIENLTLRAEDGGPGYVDGIDSAIALKSALPEFFSGTGDIAGQIKSIDDLASTDEISTFELKKLIQIGDKDIDIVIVGTKKKDKITGTSEGEILAGMKGKDVLKGGKGADGFLFDETGGFGNKHADQIKDFNSDEGDSILLDNNLFDLGKKIKLKSYGSKNKVKKAAKSKNDFVYDDKKGLLYFNENGKQKGWGDGGLFAKLQGAPELGSDDFTIF